MPHAVTSRSRSNASVDHSSWRVGRPQARESPLPVTASSGLPRSAQHSRNILPRSDGLPMIRAGAYVCMGQIRLFLPRFGPFSHRFFAVFSRCPASWRQDGENAPKTAENGRKMAEIVVPQPPKSYVYPTPADDRSGGAGGGADDGRVLRAASGGRDGKAVTVALTGSQQI